jgi:polyisoprenoid-binding protein YceI
MSPRAPRTSPQLRRALRAAFAVAAIASAACLASPLRAQQIAFDFDPQHTQVDFALTGNVHDTHGTFALKRGNLILDSATGKASGQIVVDAASGDSGNATRDRRMREEILESDKFPEIVFTPDRVEGQIPQQGEFQLNVHGLFRIHGADHDLLLPVHAKRDPSGIAASIEFSIPYVQWGMKNPSNFLLKVSDHVDISIHTTAIAAAAIPPTPSPSPH